MKTIMKILGLFLLTCALTACSILGSHSGQELSRNCCCCCCCNHNCDQHQQGCSDKIDSSLPSKTAKEKSSSKRSLVKQSTKDINNDSRAKLNPSIIQKKRENYRGEAAMIEPKHIPAPQKVAKKKSSTTENAHRYSEKLPYFKKYATHKHTSRATVLAAQQALRNSGIDTEVDGEYGLDTYNAIRAFQAGRGLPNTGALDSATLRELGINP
ncbi:MAG TPA: peptidoglycan-binding domain-containing protein [Oligoflexia bacterium]|nr:peptidoglycan-binding domain-containing protein [Oligoflexia bacterium]HMP27453.1 peptidoglycan-binding domain-containing protein [Oligoflexia bacterium]